MSSRRVRGCVHVVLRFVFFDAFPLPLVAAIVVGEGKGVGGALVCFVLASETFCGTRHCSRQMMNAEVSRPAD